MRTAIQCVEYPAYLGIEMGDHGVVVGEMLAHLVGIAGEGGKPLVSDLQRAGLAGSTGLALGAGVELEVLTDA